MPKEKLEEVLEILSRYNENQSVTDYYQLFGFNKNMTVEEIKSQIKQKRLQVLFHPDQISFIPSEHHDKYLKMIEIIKDVVNTFDNYQNKESYDQSLFNRSNNNQQSNYYEEDKTEDLDEINFGQAIILNSNKHGFKFTRDAIYHLIKYQNVNGFTRDNNVRNMVANIDRNKLMDILLSHSVKDKNVTLEQIIMNYLSDFVYSNQTIKKQLDCIEKACSDTINKYDINGYRNQTTNALNRFCNNGDVSAFTNSNGGRTNLEHNVDYRNAKFFVECSLNNERHQNPSLAYQYTKDIPNEINRVYCEVLIQKIKSKVYSDEQTNYYR